ncbi:MAG: Nif3-like dinuclear metal center hexameric protein [Aeromonadales bacterium]|nr:Nif3-like dinuclear metal center hexameric protein [Aeromonadales bacterium]
MLLEELVSYLYKYLDARSFSFDPSLNGLQVEGYKECTNIATACSVSLESIDAAIDLGADTLLVHHGLFWKGQMHPVVGPLKDRLYALLEANINLIAYHLPLDAHNVVGNNKYLADILSLNELDYVNPGDPKSIAMQGVLSEPMTIKQVGQRLAQALQTRVEVLGDGDENILLSDIAVCSGSGSFLIDDNMKPGFHALITGDVNTQTYQLAKETGTAVFVLGHHASEQGGVKRLGDHLARKFSLEHHHLHFGLEKESKVYDENCD